MQEPTLKNKPKAQCINNPVSLEMKRCCCCERRHSLREKHAMVPKPK